MEPIRWLIHGSPGTGKTKYVVQKTKEEVYQRVLKWDVGVNYQIVALQAVMAELSGGDTIHYVAFLR